MLKNMYRIERGRDLHTHLNMGCLGFFRDSIVVVQEEQGCPMGHPAIAGAKSSGRASFGSDILCAPTESLYQLSQGGLRLTLSNGHCMQICTMALPAGANPGLAVIVIKLLAPFYLHFSKRKNPFMR